MTKTMTNKKGEQVEILFFASAGAETPQARRSREAEEKEAGR